MSEQSVIARAKEAFECLERVRKNIGDIKMKFLDVAEDVSLMRREKYHKAWGYDTFREAVREEFEFKNESYAHNVANLYDTFILKLGFTKEQLANADKALLIQITGYVNGLHRDKGTDAFEEVLEIVGRAAPVDKGGMGRVMFSKYSTSLRAGSTLEELDNCEHEGYWKQIPAMRRCSHCGINEVMPVIAIPHG